MQESRLMEPYSVLMSVYKGESEQYFRGAVESMLAQTLPPDEIVVVCDGPLYEALDQVILSFADKIKVVRLKENRGLGQALAYGLQACTHEWIARMDSDDLSDPDRCYKQMTYLAEHPEVDILSGTIGEFNGGYTDAEEAREAVSSYKKLPLNHTDIVRYMKRRNPLNHPCVMFRKSKVESAGGYQPFHLFEDYALWVRMYLDGCVFANLPDTLLYMRVNGMYDRRGGWQYAKDIVAFRRWLFKKNVIAFPDFAAFTAARVVVSLMPGSMRRWIYKKRLRQVRTEI
jgi:glycosyltransferase involved in cell wall biosynthesis